jgi:class 3 adenylate cyclase
VPDEYPHRLPEDPLQASAARALEDGRLAGEVLDAGWRLRYVSRELRNLVGFYEDDELGYGVVSVARATMLPEVWRLSEKSLRTWWKLDGPYLRHDLGGEGEEVTDADLGPLAETLLAVDAVAPPIAWAGSFVTTFPDRSPAAVSRLSVRLVREDGSLGGILGLYVGGGLRGSVQAMLSRGDAGMYERMAALTEPKRRPSAILFTDLEASAVLSRKLSTQRYFDLIAELTTLIDAAVIDNGGIVGKHVGDGVSAFFLAEQCGGEDGAAGAALRAVCQIMASASSLEISDEPLDVNAGVHWGATPVIGQVVTGGRLEVSALGDEVNQAARLQEAARGGRALASKDLLERIDADLAVRLLGADPTAAGYQILGELEGVGEKARRDAGGLAVAELRFAGD